MRSLIVMLFVVVAGCGESTTPDQTTGPIVFIGDSITEFWPLETYVVGATNAGRRGERTPDMVERFGREVLVHRPKAVVILGGINDINRRGDEGVADASKIFEMVLMAQAADARVYVGTILPAAGTQLLNPALAPVLIDELNRQLADGVSQYGYELVRFHDAMLKGDGSLNKGNFTDGLHPSNRGYAVMWQILEPILFADGLLVLQ